MSGPCKEKEPDMTDTPDWADEIVGKVFEDASGMIGEMTDCAQALRDLAAEKDKEIERLRRALGTVPTVLKYPPWWIKPNRLMIWLRVPMMWRLQILYLVLYLAMSVRRAAGKDH